jgi:hypothetical protein
VEEILHPFFRCLTDEELWFDTVSALIQQGCPCTLAVTGDRIICSGLWSAHTSDLNPCDFYLRGTIEQEMYISDRHTIEELKENMRREEYFIYQ